jgi:hypothetical protein
LPIESNDSFGRSARLQLSHANNPTFSAIMLSKHATLIANCLGLGLLMALTACQPTGSMPSSSMNNSSSASNPETNSASASGKNDKTAQTALYRLNPAPQEGYEVTLKIENAPGPFKQIRWSAMYQAKGCNYVVNEWAGVRGEPEKVLELPFKEQADGSFVAMVYLDAMLDEDYYGNGVCKWEMTSVGANGTPTGSPDEAWLGGDLNLEAVKGESSQAWFYPRSWYRKLALKPINEHAHVSRSVLGWTDRSQLPAEVQNDLLSFSFHVRKRQP